LARLGEAVNIDLWNFRPKDGADKKSDPISPIHGRGKKWDHQNTLASDPEKLNRNVRVAVTKYTDKPFQDLSGAQSRTF